MKPKPKEGKTGLFLPPRNAADYSANWKNLQMVLNLKEKSNEKELNSLPIKEPEKPAQTVNKDTKKQADQISDKLLNRSNATRSGPKGVEIKQSGIHSKQDKYEKRKIKEVKQGEKEQTDKRKKVDEVEQNPTEADIWFDDIDPDDIEAAVGSKAADIVRRRNGVTKTQDTITQKSIEQMLAKESAGDCLTHAVAMDCEMVGTGPEGEESMLARVSIVNYFGKCVYDRYVKPTEKVTDYRTAVSGIRPADIQCGENFKTVQQEVAKILKGRILVGHAIHNDLKSGRPALRVLCQEILNVKVQQGEHSSVQDAQAAMRLYTLVKKKWEAELKASRGKTSSQKSPRKPRTKTDLGTTQMN
ncbi:RNA exonuclease 4 [Bagarius yarrelli]|uniref:RNA exonuclease 4 n=1 Tax=Bagarius yarrelli TaxID=175774 RepID=A0A556TU16_BAGYA|nr:RNA exonuclease 4 [Bagarius yarrelli]